MPLLDLDNLIRYKPAVKRLDAWARSDDDLMPEGLEPAYLSWLISTLGKERDALAKMLRARRRGGHAVAVAEKRIGGEG